MPQEQNREYTERLIEFANRLVLKRPDLNLLGNHPRNEYPIITQNLEALLQERHAKGKLLLPNLSAFQNQALGIFSDYSGEGSGTYYTYSVLVCGYGFTSSFSEKMKLVRKNFRLGDKEIAFKDFGMGQVRASLPDYLAAANELPGFLCTLAVDKRIATLFGPHDDPSSLQKIADLLANNRLGGRKPREAEKLLRVVHMAAFMAALLGTDGQKIFWMTDNDAICANPDQHQSMMALFDRVLPIYTRSGVNFPLLGGALPFQPKSVEMNDLLSIADVVAGSVAQYLTKSDTEPQEMITLKEGAEKVFAFLGREDIGLKKATFLIRLNSKGELERGDIDIALRNPLADAMLVPIFDN